MRKLKLQVQTSADGYMAGPNDEMDWMAGPWTDDLNEYVAALTGSVDTIVLGRRLAEGFIPAWASGPEGEEQESIDWMNGTPKVVVSNSLKTSPWEGVEVVGGDLVRAMNEVKARPGGEMIVYGGGMLVSGLIAEGLIDDLYLFVNPTAMGAGTPVFPAGSYRPLQLVEARPFECGVTAMHYRPVATDATAKE